MISVYTLFFPFLIAFILVIATTPVMISVAQRFKLIDDPKIRKHPAIVHTKPTPRGGGVPIGIGIILTSLLFLPIDRTLVLVLLGASIAVLVGVLDDKYDLSPYARLISNFFVALLPVFGGITILFITNPASPNGILSFDNLRLPLGVFGKDSVILMADILSLLWIVWTMNMLNWSTGVNGQMPGIAAIAAITIGFLSLRFSQLDEASLRTAQLSFITAGAVAGFLPFNFPNARIFPGYGGTIIGFMLAVLSIHAGTKVATALLVMAVPTIDAVFTIMRRIAAARSPFRGDRGHLHHLLLQKGFKVWQIAIFYWAISLLLGIIALTLSSTQKLFALIALAIVIGGGLLWLSYLSEEETTKA